MRWCKKTDRDRRSKKVKAKFLPSSISFSCCFSFSLFRLHFCFRARADSLCNEASLSLSLSLLHEGLQGFNMSEPNGGGVPSGDGRLDGLAGGAASADDDTARMPPPPPRLKKPLEASLNPLLVGATVVSASGPPPQRLNVRCCCVFESVVEQGEEKERGGASSNIPKRTKKNQKKKQGDSTSTSTSASTSQPAPAPLAKRGRRGKIPLEKGYSQVEWLRRSRERQGRYLFVFLCLFAFFFVPPFSL